MRNMSRLLLYFFCFLSISTLGQTTVVSNDRMNICYLGVPNPLSIVCEGYSCTDIKVSVDNGTLKKEEPCHYEFNPRQIGKAEVSVYTVKRGDTIILGRSILRVKALPLPTAMLAGGGTLNGIITKAALQRILGVIAVLDGFDFDAKFIVTDFVLILVSSKTEIKQYVSTKGPFITDEMKEGLSKLQSGDVLCIKDIKCRLPDRQLVDLNPIVLSVQ